MNHWAVDDVVDPPTVNLKASLDDLHGQLDFIVEEIEGIENLLGDLRERAWEYEEVRNKLEEKIDELDEELEDAAA
jgi:chromosome segregation ATPase